MSQKSPLFEFGDFLAEKANDRMPEDCIQAAGVVLELYRDEVAQRPELASTELQCGVVLEIKPELSPRTRHLHASNFLLAQLADSDVYEYVSVDAHNKGARRDNDWIEVANKIDWTAFTQTSVGYVEKTQDYDSDKTRLRSGTTTELRKTPFKLDPEATHAVIIGEAISDQVIYELDTFLRGNPELDRPVNKQKLPILLLSRNKKTID